MPSEKAGTFDINLSDADFVRLIGSVVSEFQHGALLDDLYTRRGHKLVNDVLRFLTAEGLWDATLQAFTDRGMYVSQLILDERRWSNAWNWCRLRNRPIRFADMVTLLEGKFLEASTVAAAPEKKVAHIAEDKHVSDYRSYARIAFRVQIIQACYQAIHESIVAYTEKQNNDTIRLLSNEEMAEEIDRIKELIADLWQLQ